MQTEINFEQEIWKDIPEFEGFYQVSNYGRIKSLLRRGTIKNEKYLHIKASKTGYCNVTLCKNNIKKQYRVNRLVAMEFVPNPLNKPEVNHEDGIKTNNYSTNLTWCTNSENKYHAYKNGLMSAKGENNNQSKLNKTDVLRIIKLLKTNTNQKSIAKLYNVSQQTISDINCKKLWNYE